MPIGLTSRAGGGLTIYQIVLHTQNDQYCTVDVMCFSN